MSTTTTWPGGATDPTPTAYSVPSGGELNWQALSNFLNALAASAQSTSFQKFAVRKATSSPVTVSATTDCVVATNLTVAGAVTVNLPAGANKQVFVLVDDKGDAATNNVTINRNGTDTIAGGTSVTLATDREAIILVYNSADTDWKIAGRMRTTVNLTSGVSGILPTANGGTGQNSTATFPTSGTVVTREAIETLSGAKTFSGSVTPITVTTANDAEVNIVMSRTVNTPSAWSIFLPQGSTDWRLFNVSARFVVTSGGTVLVPGLSTDGPIYTSGGTGQFNSEAQLAVSRGGTGLASGTSGGVPYYSASTTIASSGALTANALVKGGGAGSAPSALALGTANQMVGMNAGATANEYKTLAVGTSGSDFAVANAANSVTFNLPDAGASARGAVTTVAQAFAGVKTLGSGARMNSDTSNGGASILTYYREDDSNTSTFTWNGSGSPGTSGAITLHLTRVGRLINLVMSGFTATTGTSSTALASNTALPSWAIPSVESWTACEIVDNGTRTIGSVFVKTDGKINIVKPGSATFTNASTCGLWANMAISYYI